eukprot:5817960-Prymnesium_polylepis.1
MEHGQASGSSSTYGGESRAAYMEHGQASGLSSTYGGDSRAAYMEHGRALGGSGLSKHVRGGFTLASLPYASCGPLK